MNDLISRQAVLEATSTTLKITGKENAETVYGYIKKLCDDIKALPSAQQWFHAVRDCQRNESIQTRFWNGAGYVDAYVTHWMPLPDPIEEENNELDTM